MCDPTGISEGAAIASVAGPAFLGGTTSLAAGSTAVAAGTAAAGGIFGTGISGATAAGIAATGVSTGLSMFGRMAASAQTAQLYIQNAENQNVALAQNYNGLNLRQSQIADKTATDNFDVLRGLAIAKGKATAAAGEAGVQGVSMSNVYSDLEMRDGLAVGTNDYNYTAGIENVQNEKEAAKSRTEANIASMPQPNALGMYAGIGADAVTGALKIYDIANKANLFASKPTGSTS